MMNTIEINLPADGLAWTPAEMKRFANAVETNPRYPPDFVSISNKVGTRCPLACKLLYQNSVRFKRVRWMISEECYQLVPMEMEPALKPLQGEPKPMSLMVTLGCICIGWNMAFRNPVPESVMGYFKLFASVFVDFVGWVWGCVKGGGQKALKTVVSQGLLGAMTRVFTSWTNKDGE